MATKSPADQVKEAVWKYAAQAVVLGVVFGGGFFVGYQKWGAGENGQPALAERAKELDLEVNRLKNERRELQSQLEVTTARKKEIDQIVTDLRKQLADATRTGGVETP